MQCIYLFVLYGTCVLVPNNWMEIWFTYISQNISICIKRMIFINSPFSKYNPNVSANTLVLHSNCITNQRRQAIRGQATAVYPCTILFWNKWHRQSKHYQCRFQRDKIRQAWTTIVARRHLPIHRNSITCQLMAPYVHLLWIELF